MSRERRWFTHGVRQRVSACVGLAALGVALLGGGTTAIAQSGTEFSAGDTVIVATDDLQFRAEAGLRADVLSVLTDGTYATVTDGPIAADDYTWYALDIDGETGWAAAEYLVFASESEALLPGAVVTIVSDDVNLRDGASLEGAILTNLMTGTSATIVSGPETVDDYDWYEIEVDGTVGWVVSDYLATSGSTIPLDVGATALVDTDGDILSLRAAAGFETEILDYLESGATVTIVSGPTEVDGYEWYEVTTDLGNGWVAGMYLAAADTTTVSV